MNRIALRLMAVVAIILLLGGPAVSAHADTGASATAHPRVTLRQTLEGTPQVDVIEPTETVLPATEVPVDGTELQETAAPVQTEAPLPPTEPIETLPPMTEPVETEPPATEEPFIFVFCHVSPDGSQVTMRISTDDPAITGYITFGHISGPALLFPDDYWGECIAPSPTVVAPTEQPTAVTEVPRQRLSRPRRLSQRQPQRDQWRHRRQPHRPRRPPCRVLRRQRPQHPKRRQQPQPAR
jgi:hypothetical protein